MPEMRDECMLSIIIPIYLYDYYGTVVVFVLNTKIRDEICAQLETYGFDVVLRTACGPIIMKRESL
jgi:hypothetical protein